MAPISVAIQPHWLASSLWHPGLSQREIIQQAQDIIKGQLDGLMDSVQSGDIPVDPERCHQEVRSSVELQLSELGLILVNFRRE